MARFKDVAADFEAALEPPNRPVYVLRLYVAGSTLQSTRAILQLKEICATHLKDRHSLEVVDIYQQPDLARQEQIVAVPTLIRRLPLPLRRIIGDLSNEHRVLVGLDLLATAEERKKTTKPKPYGKKTRTKDGPPR